LTSFFSILPVYGFKKSLKTFVLFYCMDPRFLSKNSAKLWFLFSKKNWDIWNQKFQQNSIIYYFFFFSIFGIFFSISPIQTGPKIMEFFIVFYWKG